MRRRPAINYTINEFEQNFDIQNRNIREFKMKRNCFQKFYYKIFLVVISYKMKMSEPLPIN